MRAWVYLLWDDGKPVPRWRFGGLRPAFGELVLHRTRDSLLSKTALCARLARVDGANQDALPVLQDAAVIEFIDDVMHISGVATVMQKTQAQMWQAIIVADDEEELTPAELNMQYMPDVVRAIK